MQIKIYSFALCLFLVACSKPEDIVFGPEPLKQMAEQGEKFKKLPEQDRMLLAAFLGTQEVAKAFGGVGAKPIAGRTVGEVLVDAQAWKQRMLVAEEEAKKQQAAADTLKAKVLAERKAIADQIQASVVLAVTNKRVLPKNYETGRYQEMLLLTYAIENKSDKSILQLKGRIHFMDATGDEIGSLALNIDQSIAAGKTVTTDTGRGWELNQFLNGNVEKIAGREFDHMTTSFEPESIAFEGGEVLKAPEL